MKKILSVTLVFALFSATSLFASNNVILDTKNIQKTQSILAKSDMELLFGSEVQNLNAEVLADKEMQETKGEFWIDLGVGLTVLAIDKLGQKKGWW